MRSATALLLLVLASPAVAGEISGSVYVVDGDTVDVDGTRVRLKGVDASEMRTARGREARAAMIAIVGKQNLTCQLTGEKTWKREVGFCTTEGGVDIGQAIIESGWALACARYSTRYVEFEQESALAVQERASYCERKRKR